MEELLKYILDLKNAVDMLEVRGVRNAKIITYVSDRLDILANGLAEEPAATDQNGNEGAA